MQKINQARLLADCTDIIVSRLSFAFEIIPNHIGNKKMFTLISIKTFIR